MWLGHMAVALVTWEAHEPFFCKMFPITYAHEGKASNFQRTNGVPLRAESNPRSANWSARIQVFLLLVPVSLTGSIKTPQGDWMDGKISSPIIAGRSSWVTVLITGTGWLAQVCQNSGLNSVKLAQNNICPQASVPRSVGEWQSWSADSHTFIFLLT